ncbi:MAG: response regulator transcription factor [Anaerolineales bacterium]|jgi:DNA-binding NarL/FixJ family response regulator
MIKILICDDQMIVCEGLEKILSSDPDLEVVGIANNGIEAIEMIPKVKPDLILMDLKMPKMNGSIATRKITARYPEIAVLVLTTYDDDEWIFDAIRSGASGYLLKDLPPGELVKAIKGTVSGQSYIDPAITRKILDDIIDRSPQEKKPTNFQLSERELEILSLIIKGYSNAEIADALFLSKGTIRNYLSDLFKTLGVSDRTQAAVVAVKYRLVKMSD